MEVLEAAVLVQDLDVTTKSNCLKKALLQGAPTVPKLTVEIIHFDCFFKILSHYKPCASRVLTMRGDPNFTEAFMKGNDEH